MTMECLFRVIVGSWEENEIYVSVVPLFCKVGNLNDFR